MGLPWGSLAPITLQWDNIKILFSETTRPRAFIFVYNNIVTLLFINPANRASGVHTGHAQGRRYLRKYIKNTFFSETTRPKSCIFGMQDCHVEFYINPANYVPGVKNIPTSRVIIGH